MNLFDAASANHTPQSSVRPRPNPPMKENSCLPSLPDYAAGQQAGAMISELLSQCTLYFDDLIGLNYIPNLDIVVVQDVQTAVLAGNNLLDVVLEPLEGAEFSGVDNDAVTDDTNLGSALELALADNRAGDGSDL